MSSTPPYRYINGKELAEIMKSEDQKPLEDYVVVDVRDGDSIGGNILNCLPAPSAKLEDNLNELIEKTKDVKKVIFHCALSQVRGPKSARIYAEARKEKLKDEAPPQEVLVLRGGFTEFQAAYRDDPKLVEKWQEEVWGADGSGYY